MGARASTWLSLLVVSALTIAVGFGVGGAVAAPDATAYKEYTDVSGDAGPGTDITNLTVRNDDSGGVSIQVVSATPVVANHAIAIFVDSDRNQSTGGDGDDYWMFGGPLVGKAFFAWNGSKFVETNPGSFSVGLTGSNMTEFRFNRADIGNVSGFNFVAVSISIDPPKVNFWDGAPDRGYFSYDLTTPEPPTTTTTPPAPVVSPVIGKPVVTPATLVAGKRTTVTFPVTRSDNGQPLTTAQMICNPSVAGKQLAHTESLKAGKARVTFLVPQTAKGKQLQVKVTIKTGQRSATKVATFRVR